VVQMAQWVLYPKPWSLAACGAAVGWVTDWAALKMLFEPVNRHPLCPWQQGLFLKPARQAAVAREFGAFMGGRVLHPEALWRATLQDPRFIDLLGESIHRECGPLVKGGRAGARRLAAALGPALQKRATGQTHAYVANQLNLAGELERGMRGLSSAQFEDVLHPVFQEDEATLMAVGGVLGFTAGIIQAALQPVSK